MKKKISKIVVILLCVILSIPVYASEKSSVRLNKESVVMENGTSTNITLLNTKEKVKWKVDRKSVVTMLPINQRSVLVIAKKEGKAVITANVGKKKYSCKITVQGDAFSSQKTELSYLANDHLLTWNKVPDATGYLLRITRIKGANEIMEEEIILSKSCTRYQIKSAEAWEQYISITPFKKVADSRVYGEATTIQFAPEYE